MGEIAEQSSSSYRLMHMLVRRIFKAALRAHKIAEDPTTDLSSKGGKAPKELSALSDEQQKALLLAVSGLPVELFVLLGLFAGLRREETLALQWDCVFLDCDSPFIRIRRTWHISHNAPVITDDTKTEAGKREIPIPPILVSALAAAKKSSTSKFVIANAGGGPLTGTQWRNLWKQVTVRTTAERTYKRYKDGSHTTHTVAPRLGASAKNNPGVVYSMDFQVTSHKLRRTYITNLIASGIDPKTVQYLAGHENIKITLDIYAKVKYNQPEKLAPVINKAFSASDEKG